MADEIKTDYHPDTRKEVVAVLERCRRDGTRVRIDLGDAETGRSWGEEFDCEGRVGRTSGRIRSPILLANARSLGGGLISTQNIVAIMLANGGQTLWRHPDYLPSHDWPEARVIGPGEDGRFSVVAVSNKDGAMGEAASFGDEASARRWIEKKLRFEPSPEARADLAPRI